MLHGRGQLALLGLSRHDVAKLGGARCGPYAHEHDVGLVACGGLGHACGGLEVARFGVDVAGHDHDNLLRVALPLVEQEVHGQGNGGEGVVALGLSDEVDAGAQLVGDDVD